MLREVQKIDTQDKGYFTFVMVLELIRALDNYWDIVERRTALSIIDETQYSELDIENLRQIFNAYSEVVPDEDGKGSQGKPVMGVSELQLDNLLSYLLSYVIVRY